MLKLSVGKGRQVMKQFCCRVLQYYATVATERAGYVLYRALVFAVYRRHKEELSRDSHISRLRIASSPGPSQRGEKGPGDEARLRKELEENQQKLALLEEIGWLILCCHCVNF